MNHLPANLATNMDNYIKGSDDPKMASFLAAHSFIPPSNPVREAQGASPQSVKTSLLVEQSISTGGSSLPALISDASSYAPESVSTGMADRDLVHNQRALGELPRPSPLKCPFGILDCHREFNHGNVREWIKHSSIHFRKLSRPGKPPTYIKPPTHGRCGFCEQEFRAPKGDLCWLQRMKHTKLHHELGHRIDRPDFTLIEYLWQQGVMSVEKYRELKPTEGLPSPPPSDDGLPPVTSIQENRRGDRY